MRGVFRKSFQFLLFALLGLAAGKAQAYHHFIGLGYTSCMTCHYNGAGSGQLNDYGRALFAAEITSRWWAPKSWDDDKLSQHSQFIPGVDLPYYVRPGFKYRGLGLENQPGVKDIGNARRKQWYTMQNEAELTLSADRDNKSILVLSQDMYNVTKITRGFSSGYVDRDGDSDKWVWKDLYARVQLSDTSWIYAGQTDKVFGIREIDHTTFSRTYAGINQFDQSVGLIYQKSETPWEYFIEIFQGNIDEKSDYQLKGASAMFEYEPMEKMRIGFSIKDEKNDYQERTAFAVHERLGLGAGNALSAELGVTQRRNFGSLDQNPSASQPTTQPGYLMVQSYIPIVRGFNFLSYLQWGRSDLSDGTAQIWKWDIGLLTFPLPRSELRLDAVNSRTYGTDGGSQENWTLETQIHFSL